MEEKEVVLRCPYCEHDTFIRTGIAIVKVYDDVDSLRDEFDEEEYTYKCGKCDRDVDLKDCKEFRGGE